MRAHPPLKVHKTAGALKYAALAIPLALTVLLGAGTARADFVAGVDAYDRGDFQAAYDEWLPLAREGDPAAQRNIGHLYRRGQGVPQDSAVAVNWYIRAAEAGLPRAQANLAAMYLRGEGIDQDERAAAIWYHRAAIEGHTISRFNLGLMYQQGLGVDANLARAMGWFGQAAEDGHEKSVEMLDALVARGVSPASEKDLLAALKRLETQNEPRISPSGAETPIQAARINESAEVEPGLLAYREQAYDRALSLWLPLAGQGNSEAQFFVGGLYMDGSGVEEDMVQAHAWWQLASQQGHAKAREFLELIGAIMTEDQRKRAAQLALTLASGP